MGRKESKPPALFILQGKRVVHVADAREWIAWLRTAKLVIAADEVRVRGQAVTVITSFTGFDHELREGFHLPRLFKTFVRDLPEPLRVQHYVDYYTGYEEALAGHAAALGQLLTLTEEAPDHTKDQPC